MCVCVRESGLDQVVGVGERKQDGSYKAWGVSPGGLGGGGALHRGPAPVCCLGGGVGNSVEKGGGGRRETEGGRETERAWGGRGGGLAHDRESPG